MHSDFEAWMFMACPEYEDRILELPDASLPAAEKQAVEAHLALCPGCRAFAEGLGQLDVELAAVFRRAEPRPGFKARLLQRLDAEPAPAPAEAVAARKQRYEAEYQAYAGRLRHIVWQRHVPHFLDALGIVSLLTVGWLGLQLLLARNPQITQWSRAASPPDVTLYLCWGLTVLVLGGVAAFLGRRRLGAVLGRL